MSCNDYILKSNNEYVYEGNDSGQYKAIVTMSNQESTKYTFKVDIVLEGAKEEEDEDGGSLLQYQMGLLVLLLGVLSL